MTFDDTAIDWLADLLSVAAVAEIMPRFRRLDEGDVRQKTSAADLVTEADVNAERLITARLRERYPQAMIVGEEACSDDPALLQGLGLRQDLGAHELLPEPLAHGHRRATLGGQRLLPVLGRAESLRRGWRVLGELRRTIVATMSVPKWLCCY